METAKTLSLTFKIRDLDGLKGRRREENGFPVLPGLNAGQSWGWSEDLDKGGPGGPGQESPQRLETLILGPEGGGERWEEGGVPLSGVTRKARLSCWPGKGTLAGWVLADLAVS